MKNLQLVGFVFLFIFLGYLFLRVLNSSSCSSGESNIMKVPSFVLNPANWKQTGEQNWIVVDESHGKLWNIQYDSSFQKYIIHDPPIDSSSSPSSSSPSSTSVTSPSPTCFLSLDQVLSYFLYQLQNRNLVFSTPREFEEAMMITQPGQWRSWVPCSSSPSSSSCRNYCVLGNAFGLQYQWQIYWQPDSDKTCCQNSDSNQPPNSSRPYGQWKLVGNKISV